MSFEHETKRLAAALKDIPWVMSQMEDRTPDEQLKWELVLAWDDLSSAMNRAISGVWSIECGGQLLRIAELTKLVGPIEWKQVHIRHFLVNDFYHQIHKALGYEVPGMEAYGETVETWKNGEMATQNGHKPIGY